MKEPCVYMMTNARHGTLYVGVASSLQARVWQHKNGVMRGFTFKYGLHHLVWYERHDTMDKAISREKQLKGGTRQRKIDLIEGMNPEWVDLYDSIVG